MPIDRVVVRDEDLLDVPLGDDVAHGGAPVAGHHHAVGQVTATMVVACGSCSAALLDEPATGQQLRFGDGEEVGE